MEYELAYYDSAVHRFNHYTTRTPPKNTQVVTKTNIIVMTKTNILVVTKTDIPVSTETNMLVVVIY